MVVSGIELVELDKDAFFCELERNSVAFQAGPDRIPGFRRDRTGLCQVL